MPEVKPPEITITITPGVPRLKKMVEYVLHDNPKYNGVEARNSDVALTICIWQRFYGVGTNHDSVVHLSRILELPSEDKIGRVRRTFQNTEHKYLPNDPRVLIARSILEEYWQEALGYKLTKEEWQQHYKNVAEQKQSERRAE